MVSPNPMEGAGVSDLGGLLREFLKPGKSLSSAQSLLDWVTVVAVVRGTDTVAMAAWMDMLPASLAALKWWNVPLDMSEESIEEEESVINRGMGEAPEEEQKEGEICPPPPTGADVTGVEWTRPIEVDWITDPIPAEEGVPTKFATKCEGAT